MQLKLEHKIYNHIMEKLINQFEFGLFWQILIFVGLILLLKKFALKPFLTL
jgi:F-type H+-transporting ATPase subunit b